MKKLNLAPYLIEERLSIKDALNLIDKNKKRFFIVEFVYRFALPPLPLSVFVLLVKIIILYKKTNRLQQNSRRPKKDHLNDF